MIRLGDLDGNNKCRNPDGESSPWCFTGENEYDLCDIPSCELKTLEENDLVETSTCGSDRFQCRYD